VVGTHPIVLGSEHVDLIPFEKVATSRGVRRRYSQLEVVAHAHEARWTHWALALGNVRSSDERTRQEISEATESLLPSIRRDTAVLTSRTGDVWA
jgi:hypothetical protein